MPATRKPNTPHAISRLRFRCSKRSLRQDFRIYRIFRMNLVNPVNCVILFNIPAAKPGGRHVLNFATQIARDAGNLLVQKLGVAKITTKGDINLVTEADIAAETLIIERIRSYYPQHGILAEESGEAVLVGGKRSEWKWIIDPLDGTTNYAHGYPCFCVSIALEHNGELTLGVVYDPMRDEMFAAERGQGATLNDRK